MPDDLQYLLGGMNAKLDTLLTRFDEERASTASRIEALNSRITRLEQWRWTVLGAAAAAGSVVTYVLRALT